MASLYNRGDIIWISYRNERGERKCKSTELRYSNIVERRKAERLRDTATLREHTQATITRAADWGFVLSWLDATASSASTRTIYAKRWRSLRRWLDAIDVRSPAQLTREHCLAYPHYRAQQGVGRNTARIELVLLGAILEEACRRGFIQVNPARSLHIRLEPSKEKRAFADDELEKIDDTLTSVDPCGWMRVTFLLGRYQAARLGSCAVPLADIDFGAKTIWYAKVKGGARKAYSQPLDERIIEPLRTIVEHRKLIGASTLCDLPELPSVEWRKFLDSLGIHGASHHSLRVTWVTKACLAGIPESVAQRFSNHSSTAVHRIYQKFSTADMAAMLSRLS